MSDLLELLRWYADKHNGNYEPTPHGEGCVAHTLRKAADEIERLRADKDVRRSQERNKSYEESIDELEAEIEQLRAAINAIKDDPEIGVNVYRISRTALSSEEITELNRDAMMNRSGKTR